jgi:hypothetical protein
VGYILTVSVSIASAVDQLVSAVPDLLPLRVVLGVGAVVLVTLVNLRGISESGQHLRRPDLHLSPGHVRPDWIRSGLADHPELHLAASLLEGLEKTLTVTRLALTGSLLDTFKTTTPIESMISIARNVTGNVKRWKSGKMALRWTAAGLLVAERRFRRVERLSRDGHHPTRTPQAPRRTCMSICPNQRSALRVTARHSTTILTAARSRNCPRGPLGRSSAGVRLS